MRLQVLRSAPSGRGYIEVYFTGASPRATVYAPFGSNNTAHRKLVVTPQISLHRQSLSHRGEL